MSAPSVPPTLTADQRASALLKATAVRMARRTFKDAVARGDHSLAAALALAKADEMLAGILARDILTSFPGIGMKRAEGFMADVGIAPSRRVRGLGQHQVAALISKVGR